jgi:protein-S-isoprenylcysteine O-methyltransferase Ste14
MKMARLLAPVLILPGTVLVLVPALMLWLTRGTRREAEMSQAALPRPGMPHDARPRTPDTPRTGPWRFRLAIVFGCAGIALAISTCRLFVTKGEGTPAPWDPPQKLVVRGPYRHVRNPMISGVLLLLAAQALFFSSWAVAGWLLVFFLANALYLPLIEEKGLERRFGTRYLQYKANVPRWIPRIRPWRQP